jgi:hypothetical protein
MKRSPSMITLSRSGGSAAGWEDVCWLAIVAAGSPVRVGSTGVSAVDFPELSEPVPKPRPFPSPKPGKYWPSQIPNATRPRAVAPTALRLRLPFFAAMLLSTGVSA